VEHIDPTGTDHDSFSFGLKKSLFNYMQGVGLDEPLHKWFSQEDMGFKAPKPSVPPDFIQQAVNEPELPQSKPNTKLVFVGNMPTATIITKNKKGSTWEVLNLTFNTKKETISVSLSKEQGEWLYALLPKLSVNNPIPLTLQQVQENYEQAGLEDFELFWDNKPVSTMNKVGLFRL
jgi:hypothetical protein